MYTNTLLFHNTTSEVVYRKCSKDLHFSNSILDTRVHCCLYFIPPYGHGLRQIDLEFLKRLQYKVNLIPVIAKADTLTAEEVRKLKENINREIEENDIEIYQFPDCDSGKKHIKIHSNIKGNQMRSPSRPKRKF